MAQKENEGDKKEMELAELKEDQQEDSPHVKAPEGVLPSEEPLNPEDLGVGVNSPNKEGDSP